MGKALSSIDILHWFHAMDSITLCQNQHLVCFTQECSQNCPLKVTEKSRQNCFKSLWSESEMQWHLQGSSKVRQLVRSQLEEGQALSRQGSASVLTAMSESKPWEYGPVTILSYCCRRGHTQSDSASFLGFSVCDNNLNQTHCLLASLCPLIADTLLSCGWSWQTHSQRLREYSHCRPFLLFLSFKEMGEMLAIWIGVFLI